MTEPPAAPDLLGPPRYTRHQVAALAGVPLELADRLWTAMGFAHYPDEGVVYTDADLAALRRAGDLLRTGITDPRLLTGLARAMGQNLARLAQSHAQLLAAHPEPGTDAQTAVSVPAIAELVDYVWRRHLHAALQSVDHSAQPADGSGSNVAVGFADLDGYTGLSRQLDSTELSALVDAFEDLTSTVVTQGGGRVVKTGGDDVLFTSSDPEAAAGIGLDIVDRIATHPQLPGVSVGLAYGPVIPRLGDVFGPVVNLASRLTGLAKPGSVLVDRDLAAELEGSTRLTVQALRRRSVGGYGHLAAYRVQRRAEPDSG